MAGANSKPKKGVKTYPIKDLTDIEERLYIKWRNYNETENLCYSATKKSGSDKHFVYTLRVWPYDWEHLLLYDTKMTTEATTGHTVHNAARYKFGPGYPEVLRELVFTNRAKNCFILRENLTDNQPGCQLVRPESKIERRVPQNCVEAYEKYCSKEKFELYDPVCPYIPDKVR
ncbi:hypothetical protein V5799_031483 [Amblyomma americanum]|uniref:Salivary lipocalin n=1 Tax=Amblyomma americanum TaxID=6943 RepID=A0AAQ4EK86_AMBAM